MELKRVLGSDSRSATAKAMELYGNDALIVSNERISGKVEVIVAVDLEHDQFQFLEPAGIDTRGRVNLPTGTTPAATSTAHFGEILKGRMGEMTKPADTLPIADVRANSKNSGKNTGENHNENDSDRQELERARDLVDMLRGEFAEMRKELRISQQLSAWQSSPGNADAVKPAVQPLATALLEVGVPVGLRSLLVDEILGLDNLDQAMSVVESILRRSVLREKHNPMLLGVNVIAGPSGAGKTMMVARLAAMHLRDGALQPEDLAIVSFSDRRPGAWNQIQLLAAQAGVDSYRVTDAAMLESLMSELTLRKLVLIDTPGVRVSEHLNAISNAVNKGVTEARFHLLLPADSSAATCRRYLDQPDVPWASLMMSKMDESTQPWPLIQALCDFRLPVSFSSCAPAGIESLTAADTDALIGLAMSNLPLQGEPMSRFDQTSMAKSEADVPTLNSSLNRQ
jgi:flagellar biosynthesis protein FlhF